MSEIFFANNPKNAVSHISSLLPDYIEKFISITRGSLVRTLEFEMEQEVCECLKNKKFYFLSQGICDETKKLKKIELLARLEGNDNRIIYPSTFIPIIKMKWLNTYFDYMIVEKAFEQIISNNRTIPCSININPSTFNHAFIQNIERIHKLYPINPSKIIFEVLETEKIEDYDSFNKTLSELRKRGYKIAVDDFHPLGNHNAFCVENLKEIDIVKIDGEYMKGLYFKTCTDWTLWDFLNCIFHITKKHPGIDLVVEKIENEQMFLFFRDLFIRFHIENIYFQGYFFDKGSRF